MTKYRKSWSQALQEVREDTEIGEAVLVNRDYKYDSSKGRIYISKKNFKKVPKDYKNDTPGKERMITYDSKSGTVSVPVEFTEEVELDEMGAMSAIDPDEVSLPDIVANAKKYKMSASQFKTWVKKNLKGKDQDKATKLFGEEVDLNEMKWEAGVVYHQDFGGGEISYFRADALLKNGRWKGMAVDEIGGKQKRPKI